MNIREIEPKIVWNHFADLNAIPRASKKEDQVVQFIINFGEKLGLETLVDSVQNVLIKKPATIGMENRKKVVLQSHLDMVHQKNAATTFDFDTQGIQMFVDGDWVKAKGTTLGADNGLGVAAIMSILASENIKHPTIEALFTIDEETGMTGAMGLEANFLSGDILLNLDTEEDDELGVGCAGGVDVTATKSYTPELTSDTATGIIISIKGLNGGHSGIDINKGLGNANKLMARILFALKEHIQVSNIHGGSLRNAIPRECTIIGVTSNLNATKVAFDIIATEIKDEFSSLEKTLQIELTTTETPKNNLTTKDQEQLIHILYAIHNGVFRMSPDIENLVETSNNLARIIIDNEAIEIQCLTRSSVESGKRDIVYMLQSTFELGGFSVALGGDYPGWQPNPNSAILQTMQELYQMLFNEKPKVAACHAGLECGLLGTHYPNMDMISFGPTIKGAHSPDERASISSTQKFWKFLVSTLENIPQ